MRRVFAGLALLTAMGLTGFWARDYLLGHGWTRVHAPAFAPDDCALYHVMRGLEQDPTRDPAHAALIRKCGTDYIPWSLSQTGDPVRFDRPARVRLRFDPIDMQRYSNYPPLVVEFVYPRVPLAATARWRNWNSLLAEDDPGVVARQRARWDAPWADLFARWSLGRGLHEVWLGGATIEDPGFCETVEHDRQRDEDFCRMTLVEAATGQPLNIKLPLNRRMELRLEVLEICRFGGVYRRWEHPWLQKILGTAEYSDRGCTDF